MTNMSDKFHDECGIVGIFGNPEASNLVYLGLHALQHRGQESAGIASTDGRSLYIEKGMGLVADIFNESTFKNLPGKIAIGHNRYSTSGGSKLKAAQPCTVEYSRGPLALAHNGNLVNIDILRGELEARGSIFSSTADSEVIVHLIAQSREADLKNQLCEALYQVQGAYSLLVMNEKEMIAVRDPKGIRPLSLGKLKDSYVVVSESCALDLIEADFIRDIEPGELLHFDKSGLHSYFPFPPQKEAACIFEFIYFSRPDSRIFGGRNVHETRKQFGRVLAREASVEADVVIPVPDSGISAALGYAEESKIPFETGLIRNHYVGRTFIEPQQSIRHFGVRLKLNAMREVLEGKRVIIIDDSIVRGTTSRKIISMIRNCGAKEIHMRVSAPPTVNPCYFGIDTPTRAELIAATHTVEEIRKYLTADSLSYLSIDGLKSCFKDHGRNKFCDACFTGNYPIRFPEMDKQLSLFI
jgi:amidophosphoribosyltransferase